MVLIREDEFNELRKEVHETELNIKEESVYKYQCPNCGTEFSCYGNKRRKYCSHDCYIKSRFWKGDEDGI